MRVIINQSHNILTVFKRSLSTSSSRQQQLRFDGRTAIITGAGRGLGREYALLLASRGANLVVNDYGGDRAGNESDPASKDQAAEAVVSEIKNKWPKVQAISNYESVCQSDSVRRIVEAAIDRFGQVDILINNAGILRDKSFVKMTLDDWDQVQAVHLRGSYLMSKACWSHMRKQEYGKIIMTSSTSGLYGNFGQANYSAAKMGLIGLSNTLSIEGQRNNISCNTIVPMAASRMTHDILPEDIAVKLKPAYVAPLVAWLCHESCTETGGLFEAAGKWYGRYRLHRTAGQCLPGLREGQDDSIEKISESWQKICQIDEKSTHVESFHDHLKHLLQTLDPSDRSN